MEGTGPDMRPRDYYTWCAGNAAGFILDAARWQTHGLLDLAGEACYAEEA